MNYNGKFSRTVKKNSAFVCEAFGTNFYMEAGELYHPAQSDAFVPAWLVPLPDEPTLKVKSHDVTWKYSYGGTGTGSKGQAMNIKVTIFQLVPNEQFLDKDNIHPRRPAFEGMTEKSPTPKANATSAGAGSTKASRARISEEAAEASGANHLSE